MGFELAEVLLMLVVIFAAAKLAGLLCKKINIPSLVGEIIVGVLVASLVINDQSIAEMLKLYTGHGTDRQAGEYYYIFETLAELGVIFLLFAVGLETRVKDLLSVGKAALLVASLGVIIPFILGYAYISCTTGDMYQALFLGAAMVATSVGITARVIKDMKLTDTRESRIIIGAAVIDDVLGMIVLAIVMAMAKSKDSGSMDIASIAITTAAALVLVLGVMMIALKVVPKIHDYFEEKNRKKLEADPDFIPTRLNVFALAIILCLFIAWLAESIGLAAIIGSFLAGMLFADYAFEYKLEEKVDAINSFLVSFFFVFVGLQINLSGVDVNLLVTALVVIVLAIIGKYVGCGLGAKLGDKEMDFSSINIIGVGMVPRGEVGIIVAMIGLDMGIVPPDLYTVVVLMSVITTIIAPPVLSMLFKKKYGEPYKVQPSDQI